MAPDSARLFEFVHDTVDALDFSDEELFNSWFHESCLQLVLSKNRRSAREGGRAWPDREVASVVRRYIDTLRSLRLN